MADFIEPCHFHSLSSDLLFYIFTFQDFDSIQNCLLVSRIWQEIINSTYGDSKLWFNLYRNFTSKYSANVTEMSILDRTKALPAGSLRKFLAQSNVDTSQCIEIGDFRAILIAFIIFGRRISCSTQRLLHYPEWALQLGEWRASFFHARKEFKRSSIFMSELCIFHWTFKFKPHMFFQPGVVAEDYDFENKFNQDFTYFSPMFDQFLHWRIIEESGRGIKKIQIEHYPVLTIKRLADGRWLIENENVTLTQHVIAENGDSIDPNPTPLF